MTFISYAQNQEDVLLWRALGHVADGFYIDVGANDPVEHSVTKAFYDAGWSGINIEPLPHLHQAFAAQRPRDVNLAIAAGAREDSLVLYDVPSVNGWASPEPGVAAAHRAHGFEVAELTVPMRPLAAVCAEHAHGEIHFLKIDVEGFEGEVLRGMDFARWRPWVLVIEATVPNSRVTNHDTWEALVTGQRYRFAWFDGLNRYYVAEEHAELHAALDIQPNVFDAFISHHLDKAWAATEVLAQNLRESESRAAVAAIEAHDAIARAGEAERQRVEALQRALQDEQRALAAEQRALEAEQRAVEAGQRTLHAEQRAFDLEQRVREAEQRVHEAELRMREVEQRILKADASAADAHLNAHRTAEWAHSMERELLAVRASHSWRLTRPLHRAANVVRALRRPHPLRRAANRLRTSERLRRLLIPLLLRYPWLGRRVAATLATVSQRAPASAAAGAEPVPEELRALPASVRSVLADLHRARGAHPRN